MSITAFPVLARILAEKQLLGTSVGSVALACAAVNDITAWLILAGVLLSVRASSLGVPAWLTLMGTVLFVLIMIVGGRRLFRAFERNFRALRGTITERTLVIILLIVLAAAWITESLGIHALFGAFLVGAVMPKDHDFVQRLNDKLEDVTVVLLLPLFFALTGLKTSFGVVGGVEMWLLTAAVVLVAIAGKFGGAALSARATGMTWREAGALGILMNTRGLMELVVLNIGLDIGIVSVSLFTIMVMMALVTTFMTSPLLEWIYPQRVRSAASPEALVRQKPRRQGHSPGPRQP
jgi:Kef-type K+ transport system membrane component KefB